ncbi:MAG: hypothetical protein OHK0022_55250 [Roseiflexaceae bacterium]
MAPPSTAYQPSAAEQQGFADMQARLVALLLRFDHDRFSSQIGARPAAGSPQPDQHLQPYRDLAALVLLRDELFEDILPRIVRRLSFESPRQTIIEEPPPRGRIDWERTLDRSWSETPGEPPLLVHTRQRRRDFATPENLLAVAVLLEYRSELIRLRWDDRVVAQNEALRHPLSAIVEQCERELAFPQFAGIRAAAEQLVEAGELDDLVGRVQERAIAGGNSAYDDLIAWRERLRTLPLLRRDASDAPALGADPQRDNYLYQLWIFFELADLLAQRGLLLPKGLSLKPMLLHYRWGNCTYELRHDQVVPDPVGAWTARPNIGQRVPGVRPDFYLRRIDPQSQTVRDGAQPVWREPGVVWDAKYYREQDNPSAPASPIKRMIADLALLGERYGVLLFAFHQGNGDSGQYTLAPEPHRSQTTTPDQAVVVQALRPALPAAPSAPAATLVALLDDAHTRLAVPLIPRCQGIFLDTLSAAGAALADRWGLPISSDPSELLVCPKPHIGAWRTDIVSRAVHCCTDARLCHIAGQPGAQKPIRPPRDAQELLKELEHLFVGGDPGKIDENTVDAITQRIEAVTRQFASLTGALNNLSRYEKQLGDNGFDRTLHLLGSTERESLALAFYLREQLDAINAPDYSAPVIHLARALEREVVRRIQAVPSLTASDFPGKLTLGSLGGSRNHNARVWGLIRNHVAARWNSQIDPDDPHFSITLDQLVNQLDPIVQIRNKAAHTTPVTRELFRDTLRRICNGGPLRIGVFNALLLAWPA